MAEPLKSLKAPLSAWKALTRICTETEEPRTKALDRIIKAEERRLLELKNSRKDNEE